MQYIRFFTELKQDQISLAGGKAASLGEMTQAGLPVPSGFCLTTEAYRVFVAANGLQEQIVRWSSQIGGNGQQSEDALATLHSLFAAASMPKAMADELKVAYQQLGQPPFDKLKAPPVAVRSSATAEDLPGASFAGQQDTYLNIRGTEVVQEAVQRCWASLWTARAIEYRQREGIGVDEVAMAVVVQEMVLAESAGVLFTANPVSGARDEILINAAWGLGEAVVSGLVTPDTLIIDKTTGQVKSEQIADKRVMTLRTPSGVEERPVPDAKRKQPTLESQQIDQLVALANAVETHAGRPMDLEWAIAEGRLYLLQARPITALPPEIEQPDLMGCEWSRLMLIERYPDPVTPLTWSAVKQMLLTGFNASSDLSGGVLTRSVSKGGRELSPDVPMVRLFYGRPYINMTKFNHGVANSPLKQPTGLDSAEALEGSTGTKPFSLSGFSLKMLPLLPKLINLLHTTHREWDRLLQPYQTLMQQEIGNNWKSFTTAELLEKVTQYDSLRDPLLTNHAYSMVAAEISRQLLTSMTKAWLGDENERLVTTMLSGLTGNVTVETNRALWQLAVSVRGQDELRQALKAPLQDDWREQFARLPGGTAFLSDLDAFLDTYGHRSPSYEFVLPTWREEPKPVLNMLQMYLDDSVIDPGEGEARQAAKREATVKMARQKLPLPKRLIFNRVLSLAQTYFRLRENQQFYMQLSLPMGRQMLLVLENRLREKGLLHEAGDIFFLEKPEVDALAMQLAGLPLEDRTVPANPAELVTERRAALARYQKMFPPVHLGGDPSTRSRQVASKITVSNGALRGVPASRGKATGKARLVHGAADFGKLQPGEIIVAPATTPTWTPLFGVAAGLVTNYGGLLSHAGVVAREYGLPAVLGTDNATQMIQNGDEITVDGDRGVVLVH